MTTVNKSNRPNRDFTIKDYDPKWAEQFAVYAGQLKALLGDAVVRVEHMGSTAVPGMAAKPQIDVLIEVKSLDNVKQHYKIMLSSGFEPLGDYTQIGEEYFRVSDPNGKPIASVHVLPQGHPEVAFQVKFRDYLKAHPREVHNYSELKKKLLAEHPGDYNAYGDTKRQYIDKLRKRVEAWSP